jgi:hypothetical protein
MKRVASFLFATLLALSLASAALAEQPGPQPCPGGPPCDGCPGGPHCPPDLTAQPGGAILAEQPGPQPCPGGPPCDGCPGGPHCPPDQTAQSGGLKVARVLATSEDTCPVALTLPQTAQRGR